MTDRMTYREENRSMESPHSAPLTELLGKDSIPDYRDTLPDQPGADDSSNQPAESPKRILLSRQQLESLRRRLGGAGFGHPHRHPDEQIPDQRSGAPTVF